MISDFLAPAEARRLASALLAVLAAIALVALLGFLVVPGWRYQADPDRGGAGGPLPPGTGPGGASWLDPTDYPPMRKQVIPPLDPATVLAPTAELLARGRDLYRQECAVCHGAQGRGDGPGGLALKPRPRDFTARAGWTRNPGLDGIYQTLEEGIPGTGMASFSDLSRSDRMALAHVVQAFGGAAAQDPAGLAALKRRLAATGETLPNRIPVREAIDHLCREYAAEHP